ncbi:hypothetical protein RA086_05035 [Lactiplantibacillus sp. WILCCON 0030]|uniref:Uncharacterized protein n=1 Tax=Lactiplantibacillus brownii TaxID=3069269 RepID=A0ABU1A986_9LACO|nr:hypothetical protein [Lactiplantibacillus brownii]MDQ7937008.1 hypothetical protein [Lactiplantibacillus brownii]
MKKVILGLSVVGAMAGGYWLWQQRDRLARQARQSSRIDRLKGAGLKAKGKLTGDSRDQLRGSLLADRGELKDWLVAVKCQQK